MARIVVFGKGLSARLADYYLTHDSPHEIVAFTVDRELVDGPAFKERPLVPFDEVVDRYPPDDHEMIVALGYGRMNAFREERYKDAKSLGYRLTSYVSSRATTWPDTEIGDNCLIMEEVTIQPFARIGNDVTIWSAGHVGQGCVVGDHTFLSSQSVLSSDVIVGENCFVGVNATIEPSLTIGRESVIGAGACIVTSTEPREVHAAAAGRRLPVTSDRLPAV